MPSYVTRPMLWDTRSAAALGWRESEIINAGFSDAAVPMDVVEQEATHRPDGLSSALVGYVRVIGLAADDDGAVLGHLLLTAAAVAKSEGIAGSGYRLVINNGPHACESVPHLHVHLLAKRQMNWPPG